MTWHLQQLAGRCAQTSTKGAKNEMQGGGSLAGTGGVSWSDKHGD